MYEMGICSECNREKFIHAKGLCPNCYKRIGTPKIRCFKCGEMKPHHAKNLCTKCYIQVYQLDYIKEWQDKKKNKPSIFIN